MKAPHEGDGCYCKQDMGKETVEKDAARGSRGLRQLVKSHHYRVQVQVQVGRSTEGNGLYLPVQFFHTAAGHTGRQ